MKKFFKENANWIFLFCATICIILAIMAFWSYMTLQNNEDNYAAGYEQGQKDALSESNLMFVYLPMPTHEEIKEEEPVVDTLVYEDPNWFFVEGDMDRLNAYYSLLVKQDEHMEEMETKYPIATYIYSRIMDKYNNPNVACAILGNIVRESGYDSLGRIDPDAYNKKEDAYGICQWRNIYNEKIVKGVSLEYQVDYLLDTIEDAFDDHGDLYKKGFKFADFCELQCREAAIAFAKVYERCSASSYTDRGNLALVIYNKYVISLW